MHHQQRRLRAPATATAMTALTIIAAGCSSSPASAPAPTHTPAATASAKSLAVDTPDGKASLSLDGKLPPGWPSRFPRPPGTTPAGSGSLGDPAATRMIGVFQTSGTGKDAFDFYKNSTTLTSSDVSSASIGPAFAGKLRFSGTYSGTITVTSVKSKILLIIDLTS